MKAIKLIIIFIVQLGGILGALYLLTNGEKDDPASSSDTNVLPDTAAIGDTVVIEDATDKDNRITDPLDEEEVVPPTHKSRPKQKAVVIPIESKQGKKSSVGKEKKKSSGRKKEIKHKYTCARCGALVWFQTQKELNIHRIACHSENER
mgnify:CR=1 FL=1